jgi:hypothetical protein
MSVEDIGAIAVVVFASAIILFVIGSLGISIAQNMATQIVFNNTNSQAQFAGMQNTSLKLDWVFLGIFIGLLLAMIITAWFIAGNPIFLILYFLAVIIFTVISFFLSNFWESFTVTGFFSTMIGYYPIMNFVMLRLPYFVAICGMIGLVVMFAKPRDDGGGY